MLIGDIPRLNARRYPHKPAVVYEGQEITWSALDERANRLASYMLAKGLVPGDRVAVFARNTMEWPEIDFGLAKAGLVLVPVNVRLAPSEATYVLGDSECKAAIVHSDQVELFGPVLTELDPVIQIGGSALAAGRAVDPAPGLTPDAVHFFLYTSGTTGRPKAVVNGHRNMIAQALDTTIATEARHDDVMLSITPFFTAGGMVRVLSWMFLGQTMVIHRRFDPEHTLADIARQRVTMTTFIPTMLLRTLQALDSHPEADVSSLRRISYGSAPSTPGLAKEAMERLGCDLQQRYGLTEAGGQVTILTPEDHRAMVAGKDHLVASCGRETPMADIRIMADDGTELPRGEVGEIVIRTDTMAQGYWNRPEESAATFRADGLWSGDLGRLDDEGYLYIAGRKTDMIISGGFNVYPAELERVIGTDPDIDLVAVIGAPHAEWGETPVAVIVPKAGADVAALEARVRQTCRDELAGYKQPRQFEFRTQLPLGPAGKVLKREIRAEFWPADPAPGQ
jgi:acyl-CoA synthetase (AMP-forming)/AMP-acid ligase II